MKAATLKAIEALNAARLLQGGTAIDHTKYTIVHSQDEALARAASKAWEEFESSLYMGIFINRVQVDLKARGMVMMAIDEIAVALRPSLIKVRSSDLARATRFPFELLLGRCCEELEYSDVLEPVFYYPIIFPVIVAGHFPCGWDGEPIPEAWIPQGPKDRPKGRLMVHLVSERGEGL